MRHATVRHGDHSEKFPYASVPKISHACWRGAARLILGILGARVANPQDDVARPKRSFGWAIWVVVAVGLSFAVIYAVGGCLLQTIC